ncbi:MAG: DUF1499 domain-containing protein [Vicinamibacteria bacterium]|nr:DUF1499 domain-containing protein [Vicinamibacteria bacterium]
MKRFLFRVLIIGLLAGGVAAILAWPRLNEVETGRTPEYPDLQVHEYGRSSRHILAAAERTVAKLPRWTIVGSGSGRAGSEIRAEMRAAILPLKHAVTIRITRKKGRTVVSARSRSELGKWDFGQNARNIRTFMRALDEELFLP